MKRKALVLVLAVVAVSAMGVVSASGTPTENTVHYDIVLDDETGEANVNVSITFNRNSEQSDGQRQWEIPEDAELRYVTAKHGNVTYSSEDGTISMSSDAQARVNETFYVEYSQHMSFGNSEYGGLSVMDFMLYGHADSMTAEVRIDGGTPINVFSYSNHESDIENNVAHITYQRPSEFSLAYQTEEPEIVTDNLTVFGTSSLDESEFSEAYQNAFTATGYTAAGETVPIVILEYDEYEELSAGNSVGLYEDGVVFIKKESPTSMYGTISHEITHAITHSRVGDVPQWFDEGVAEIAKSIARDRFGVPQYSFDDVYELHHYHASGEQWVYTTDNLETRFAYSYVEARMKLYIKENGFDGFHEAYASLVQSDRTRFSTSMIESISGIETIRVCDKNNESETIQCARELTEYVPEHGLSHSESGYASPKTETPTTTTTRKTVSHSPTNKSVLGVFAAMSGLIVVIFVGVLFRRR